MTSIDFLNKVHKILDSQEYNLSYSPAKSKNYMLYCNGNFMTAHHQHMRAAEQVAPHVDTALMLLGNGVIEEKGLIERRADRRKASLVDSTAILRRQLCVFVVAAAPRGGNIRKGSFHCKNLHS